MVHLGVRRASIVGVLSAVAVTAGGCTDTSLTTTTSTTASARESAALQVKNTCVDNIFYNGLLPKAPAEAECVQCIVRALGQLGLDQTPGESGDVMIADVQLTAEQSSELSNACSQADAAG
jgi:hypothetical protein